MPDMRVEIRLQSIGADCSEIMLSRWLKEVDDIVSEGDELFEVESEKATIVFEAETSGILAEIIVREGIVKEGDLLGYIDA